MDAVLKWFKKLSLKKKLIAIAVLALAIMMIFSKISGGSRKDNSDKTTTSTKEVQTTEAQAEITTESTTNRTTETTTESTTQSTSAQSETTETKKHGIDPEFKAFWDGYEKFMDSYIKFMKNPDVTSSEYLRFMADYQDYLDKTSEYENDDDLTDEEYKYMTEVELRVSAKLIAAGVS